LSEGEVKEMGMAWKDALKILKTFHAAGADGSPASMQKELEGLEESLKGWELRDESREKSFVAWRETDTVLWAENAKLRAEVERLNDLFLGEKAALKQTIATSRSQRESLELQVGELERTKNTYKAALQQITGIPVPPQMSNEATRELRGVAVDALHDEYERRVEMNRAEKPLSDGERGN
jgi:chromosome segregation ATPase